MHWMKQVLSFCFAMTMTGIIIEKCTVQMWTFWELTRRLSSIITLTADTQRKIERQSGKNPVVRHFERCFYLFSVPFHPVSSGASSVFRIIIHLRNVYGRHQVIYERVPALELQSLKAHSLRHSAVLAMEMDLRLNQWALVGCDGKILVFFIISIATYRRP